MPSLSRFLNALTLGDPPGPPAPSSYSNAQQVLDNRNGHTTDYLLASFFNLDPSSPHPLLQPTPPIHSKHIPPGCILFSLTTPNPQYHPSTAFFLTCLPDPIGFMAHSARLIRSHLGTGSSGPSRWRHSAIGLTLEDDPGLAYTSAGEIHVSLQWVGDIMREVQIGGKEMGEAVKEFKGVLLHELVHAIQYDGYGSTPVWLTESIADYVRLKAHLGPPHWRYPGQGTEERGWEDGYDAGAQFLSWMVGPKPGGGEDAREKEVRGQEVIPDIRPTATTGPAPPQSTQYPAFPPPPIPSNRPNPDPNRNRARPGPWPDIVKQLNARLEHERYHETMWSELTGIRGGLKALWAAYIGHYK